MIYYLSQALQDWVAETAWADHLSFLRLFRYITVRSAGAATTALVLSWWLGPKIIAWLRQLKFGQEYADRAEEAGDLKARVLSKKGTPTMGGLLIVLVLTASTLIWAAWNLFVELTLLSVLVLCGLGFYDDYAKITQQSGGGARPGIKLWVQVALALFIGIYLWLLPDTSKLITDIMRRLQVSGVNRRGRGGVDHRVGDCGQLQRGELNGRTGRSGDCCTLITAFVFLVFTYVAGNFTAAICRFRMSTGRGATVFCAALIGAAWGFLWFNCHPAQVFMGDTGRWRWGRVGHRRADSSTVCAGSRAVSHEAGSVIMRATRTPSARTGRRVFLMGPSYHLRKGLA